MKTIVCIGWGSLVWRPENLPCRGTWQMHGPSLSVEFARQSEDKRVTLVICPGRSRVPTRWVLLDRPDVHSAKLALAVREWKHALRYPQWIEKSIGFWERATGARYGMEADVIVTWASAQSFDGVVWTNLPCKFNGVSGAMPTEDDVVASLRALEGEGRDLAEEYVRKAPREVDTPYRQRIARDLGWTWVS